MSKLTLIIGILLIIVSVPILLIGIMDTENSPTVDIIESIACNPPEKLVVESQYWSQPNGESGQSFEYYCEIEPGLRRSVMETALLVIGGSFLIPFGLGMFLTLASSRQLARRRMDAYQTQMSDYFNAFQQEYPTASVESTVINLRDKQGEIPPQAQQILNSVLGSFSSAMTQGQLGGSLSERLAQLEEAYEKNLISKLEYDKVRQAILDSMDD